MRLEFSHLSLRDFHITDEKGDTILVTTTHEGQVNANIDKYPGVKQFTWIEPKSEQKLF